MELGVWNDMDEIVKQERIDDFAERLAIMAAKDFLGGVSDWWFDEFTEEYCEERGYDYEYVYVLSRLLFVPAIVWLASGETI